MFPSCFDTVWYREIKHSSPHSSLNTFPSRTRMIMDVVFLMKNGGSNHGWSD
jgi:hypothetical protein